MDESTAEEWVVRDDHDGPVVAGPFPNEAQARAAARARGTEAGWSEVISEPAEPESAPS